MGARKRNSATIRKEQKKNTTLAVLKNCPTSPRKMRLVADMVRGKDVEQALNLLKFSKKEASIRLEKLVVSAISNWEQKNTDNNAIGQLYIQEIFVDSARQLKRIQPAPQGRAHRIRKRSNHVTVIINKREIITEETNKN